MFRNKASFYGQELSTPHTTPKPEDHPLSAVHDCLFNIFAATLHTGGRSSIRNLRTSHAVVTGTHLSLNTVCTTVTIENDSCVKNSSRVSWHIASAKFVSYVPSVSQGVRQ
jgi:hypothetical protein